MQVFTNRLSKYLYGQVSLFGEAKMKFITKTITVTIAASAAIGMMGTAAQAASFSSPIYEVHVQSTAASGSPSGSNQYGSWNAVTSASHPTGAGNNLLYRGTTTTTNFSSLRVFDPNGDRTYSFGGAGGGIDLDPYLSSEGSSAYAPNGFQTAWNLTPENLGITQDLFVVGGADYNTSAIYHVVNLTNNGNSSVNIGWRNLYDWTVNDPNFDDGPNNQIEIAHSSVVVPATTNEFSYTPTAGDFARVSIDPGTATYQPLLGLGFDPGFVPGLPTTRPDRYDYVSWPRSFSTSYDYIVDPTRNVTGDSAGLSYFTREIGAGQTVRLTQVIFATPPNAQPPANSVPEPSSMMSILGLGLLGGSSLLKRKVQKKATVKA